MRLLTLLVLLPLNVYGFELGIENGSTGYFLSKPQYSSPAKYNAVTVRSNALEGAVANWHGRHNNGQLVSLSLVKRSGGKWFAEGGLGIAHIINDRTSLLNGNTQIMTTVGVGYKRDNVAVTYRLRNINKWGSNNIGLDFETVSISVSF